MNRWRRVSPLNLSATPIRRIESLLFQHIVAIRVEHRDEDVLVADVFGFGHYKADKLRIVAEGIGAEEELVNAKPASLGDILQGIATESHKIAKQPVVLVN